ncbi:hypothetical protein GLYMA_03G198933v4 [Glycine max]|nr:hypothetical protein GLYMA_03G198933v4 [Glycine max]KAH1070917.1 hypothetical protein GYH30_007786 [Glycine max]
MRCRIHLSLSLVISLLLDILLQSRSHRHIMFNSYFVFHCS